MNQQLSFFCWLPILMMLLISTMLILLWSCGLMQVGFELPRNYDVIFILLIAYYALLSWSLYQHILISGGKIHRVNHKNHSFAQYGGITNKEVQKLKNSDEFKQFADKGRDKVDRSNNFRKNRRQYPVHDQEQYQQDWEHQPEYITPHKLATCKKIF